MGDSKTSAPDVSVVIPCYNAERWIGRAIDSVLAQEGVTVEIIIIDDGSTDGSLDVLRTYGNHIYRESGPNRGACAARNLGLLRVSSQCVMFLDADDYIEPGTLAGMHAALTSDAADIVFAPVTAVDADGELGPRALPRLSSLSAFVSDWITGCFVPPCGVLWRRTFLQAIGAWSEQLGKNQDGELVLRAALAKAKATISPTGRSVYWVHDGPDRISNTISPSKLNDSFQVLQTLGRAMEVEKDTDRELDAAFSKATHDLQRLAHRHRLDSMAETIRQYRDAAGWPAVVGSRAHCLASQLLGLGRKERLSHWFAGLKTRRFRRMSAGTRSLISLSRICGGLAARRSMKG